MAFQLRCTACRKAFKIASPSDPWPDDCPLCGVAINMNSPRDGEICLPSIRTARSVVADKVYRDIEAGSEKRVQLAAEMAGTSEADMSSLKITNLNDARRPGDVAAMPVTPQNNVVAAFMQQNNVGGFQGNGAAHSDAVQTGPSPNAGAHMRTAIHRHHTQLSRGSAVSDTPALETQQPGYRRRG